MKMKSRRVVWMIAVMMLGIHRVAYAQASRPSQVVTRTDCGANKICNPFGEIDTLEELIEKIGTIALQIGVPIAAIMIMYSGFLFVTARGDTKQIDTAKLNFTYTVIGTGILLGATAITAILRGTIGTLR